MLRLAPTRQGRGAVVQNATRNVIGRLRRGVVLALTAVLLTAGMAARGSAASSPPKKTSNPALSAARLASGASIAGDVVASVEDDGGVPVPTGGHTSQATIATAGGLVAQLVLRSYVNEKAAKTAFAQVARSSASQPGAGPFAAGDEGTDDGQRAYVRKGAQVLTVEVTSGNAAATVPDDPGSAEGESGSLQGDPKAAAIAAGEAPAVATSLAARLAGTAAPKALVALPKGSPDPCPSGGAAAVAKIFTAKDVTSGYQPATPLPGLMCVYDVPGNGTVTTTVVTDDVLAAAVPATSASDVYDSETNGSNAAAISRDGLPPSLQALAATANGEYTFGYGGDDFKWLIEIGFPRSSDEPCLDPKRQAKADTLITWLMRKDFYRSDEEMYFGETWRGYDHNPFGCHR
jgi:hypothetical protein